MDADTLVIGAGTAGLSCSRRLSDAGISPVILEKSRGVGGRCATRRVEGQRVDHGVIFLHGADPGFLRAVESVDEATALPGWPERVKGAGTPCQPEAFHAYEKRLAFVEGVNAFPKHLARGLDIRFETRAASIELAEGRFRVHTESGAFFLAATVVLALPSVQARDLLRPLAHVTTELRAVLTLLGMMASEPCLTIIAGYPVGIAEPTWDVYYPEEARALLLVSHDSAKRRQKRSHVLVLQSRSRWARENLENQTEFWSQEILEEAARLIGPWAARPDWVQAHRWCYARAERATALTRPILIPFPGGQRLGLAGEVFAPSGGVEAAWLSGRRLARRLLGEPEE